MCDYFGPIKVKVGWKKTGNTMECYSHTSIQEPFTVNSLPMRAASSFCKFYRDSFRTVVTRKWWFLTMVLKWWEQSQNYAFWLKVRTKPSSENSAQTGVWNGSSLPPCPTPQCSDSIVKTTKSAIKKIIEEAVLTPFELYTGLLEVANLVNVRPIGRIRNYPNDGAYLCTKDIFLIGQGHKQSRFPKVHFATRITHATELVLPKNCRLLEEVVARCSSSPRAEKELERRKQECKGRCSGDFLIVADPNAVREKWRMVQFVLVCPVEDGLVRNVQINMAPRQEHTRAWRQWKLSRDDIFQIQLSLPDGNFEIFPFSAYFSSSFLFWFYFLLLRMVFECLTRFKVAFTKLFTSVLPKEKCFAEVAG